MQRVDTNNAWPDAVVSLHDREPKILMLVATSSFEPRKKIGQGLFADKVAVSLFHVHYFGRSRHLQAGQSCGLVARNQHQIHPAEPPRENCEEDFNDAKVRAVQGRAVGVTKISAFDQVLAQCAMVGHIAFDNTHNRPPGYGLIIVSGINSCLSAGRYSINRIDPLYGLIHARPLRQAKEVGGCLMSLPGPTPMSLSPSATAATAGLAADSARCGTQLAILRHYGSSSCRTLAG